MKRASYWTFTLILLGCLAMLKTRAQQAPPANAKKDAVPRYLPEDHRPPLFLREDWKHIPADTPEHPVVQESITTPGIELKIYGKNQQRIGPDEGIWEIQRASPKDDPTFIFTGPCRTPCALAVRIATTAWT